MAFERAGKMIAVGQRHSLTLNGAWGDTAITIRQGNWRNRLTGERIESGEVKIEQLLREFPVALLTREEN